MTSHITGVWVDAQQTAIAFQIDEDTIHVVDITTNPARTYDVDMVGHDWLHLPVNADGFIDWIPVEQA